MTPSAGTRLGPYEILASIGAGGMGEVYRARDQRLQREVAIKVLPSDLASDSDRLSRFEREARAASALNHPNIVTIHDIGSEGGVSYIAMELVEGATLRELMLGGPLSLKRLLQIAPQIADGLGRAHEAGIVHRDLKPENLMVKKDGLVKILDFGLAKLSTTGSGSDEGSQLPTMTGTQPGVIVGTVGYMSPEQASGEAVDFRSDQFSFGSIVYEMATGRKAFQKRTAVETLTAILKEEPEPIAGINPEVPAPLRWIVDRCLAKETENRYASTKDLARDLASVRDHLSEVSSGLGSTVTPARRGIPVLAALLALAVAVIPAAVILGRRSVRHTPPTFQQLTFRRGTVLNARYTPDGGSIIFSAAWEGGPMEIFTARLDGTESRPFGIKNADLLAVSAKGEVAVLLKKEHLKNQGGTGTLAVVPLAGGAKRELLEHVVWADWSPDGTQLAVTRRENGETLLEYPSGRVLYKTKNSLSYIRVSGSGRQVAFCERTPQGSDLRIVDSAGKATTVLQVGKTEYIIGLLWRPGDREILFCLLPQRSLKGDVSDIDVVDMSGRVRTLYRATSLLFAEDSLPDGRLLITQEKASVDLMFGSSKQPLERNLGWLTYSWFTDMSEDGGAVLFHDGTHIYLRRTDGSPAVRLGAGRDGSLSPDGRWVLASSESLHELSLIPTGPGQVRKISIGELEVDEPRFMPDGKSILFSATAKDGLKRLYVTDETGKTPRAVSEAGEPRYWAVSPDGKEIALKDTASGLKIYRLDGGAPRAIDGFDRDDGILAWSADTHFLYVNRAGEGRIERFDLATGRKELWKTLVPPDETGVYWIGSISVTRDGKFWAYSFNRSIFSELWQVTDLAMR